jgi:hypothetical protein
VGPSSSFSRLLILFRLFFLAVAVLGSTTSCKAQDKAELYGGYSYFRASIEEVQNGPVLSMRVSQHANLNGWEFSGQYKFLPFLGAVANFNGAYGTLQGARTREHAFLFGPQVSLPTKVSPFAHALIGVAKESQDPIPNPCPVVGPACSFFSSLGSDTSFASAVGVGIDVKVVPLFCVRLIQVDYLRTHLHGVTQNQPRVSAGIVFHF